MNCDLCEIMKEKESFHAIYEDNICIAILHEAPANPGQIMLLPKKHYAIFEEVPENEISHLYNTANLISANLFNTLGAHGTNILVNNGPSAGQEHTHFMINIIPRYENDNVNLDWELNQANQNDLEQIKNLLTPFIEKFFYGENKSIVEISEPDNLKELSEFLKHSKRIP